ncbi:malonyl-coenzyme A:anthocyanin 3-O-glucoside-6''-O-malonyltransferase-like isoform X2 [Cornus florida]|nr:malonyl-coenzyme A:anthocyanin 3-O-glucoside-6''-O-malonyltransferase-like isoform X2 [Cornus florida]
MINVIQHSRVSPPPGAVANQFLPLTFFDLMWIPIPPVQKLLFYDFHHSKSHFTDSLIPLLKHTLSLTLKHFFPLASNLILPSSSSSNPSKPEIRYVDGDSVSLTFAESSNDYNYLTGNQPRNADQFSPLVPKLMQEVYTNKVVVPLAALQVTLFPESAGICFGFNYHHVLADGKAFQGFMKAWASITKFGSDAELLAGGYLPFCDRTMIRDRIGVEKTFLSQVCGHEIKHEDLRHQTSNNNVRAMFVIARTDVQRLKELVMARPTIPLHVSTFTVTCAYMWVCSLKSRASTKLNDKDVDDDELEHFVFPMDCRERLDPPILATYFGNCITFCFATARHSQLMEEEEGFFVAAKSIGEAIATKVHNGEPDGVLKGLETWLSQIGSLKMDRVRSIAGSPKLRHYEPDFGWGRPQKNEIVSIDRTGFFSMSECRDSQGDVEFGVCYPKITMDAFASIFVHGLKLL